MAFRIGSFFATLGIETGGYTSGILNAQALTKAFGGTFTAFLVAPLAGAVELFKSLGKAAISTAQEILATAESVQLLVKATGQSAEVIQTLRAALEGAGESAHDADFGLKQFTKTMGEARAGGASAVQAFAALGLSVGDFASNEDALFAVLDAINTLPNAADRAARASDLLGARGGAALVAALDGGSQSVIDLKNKLLEMGLVIEGGVSRRVARAENVIENLGNVARGAARGGIAEFIAAWSGTENLDDEAIREMAVSLRSELVPAMRELGEALNEITPSLEFFANRVSEIAPLIGGTLRGVRSGATSALVMGRMPGIGGAAAVGGALGGFGGEVISGASDAGFRFAANQALSGPAAQAALTARRAAMRAKR